MTCHDTLTFRVRLSSTGCMGGWKSLQKIIYYIKTLRKLSKFCCCHIPAVQLTLSSDCDGWRVRVVNRHKYSLSAGIQIFSSLNIFRADGDRKTPTVRLLPGITLTWLLQLPIWEGVINTINIYRSVCNAELVFHVHQHRGSNPGQWGPDLPRGRPATLPAGFN